MTKTIHKSALIFLSYLFIFFPQRVEMYFVEPLNFALFSIVVLLGISIKWENAVEFLISLKRSFYSFQFGAKTCSWKTGAWFSLLTISVSRGERFFPNVLALSFLSSPFQPVPAAHIPFCCTQCITYQQQCCVWLGQSCTCKTHLAGQTTSGLCQVFLSSTLPWSVLSAFTNWYFLQNLQILRCIWDPDSPFMCL